MRARIAELLRERANTLLPINVHGVVAALQPEFPAVSPADLLEAVLEEAEGFRLPISFDKSEKP